MNTDRCPVEVVSGVPVVAAPEEIDMNSAPELRSALLEAAAHGHRMLVVDMTRTQFCDSSGVHTLLAAHERAQAEGGELLLVISATIVLRIFEVTGLDRVIRSFPSLDGALAQTSAEAGGSSSHRRADGAPEGGEPDRLAAQLSTTGLAGEPVARIACRSDPACAGRPSQG
jgi:anti-sigma B factor antagonist